MSEQLVVTEEEAEIARRAVEDQLIEMRDSRIALLGRRNGLVVCEKDGTPSEIIRLGFEMALQTGISAINAHRAKATP